MKWGIYVIRIAIVDDEKWVREKVFAIVSKFFDKHRLQVEIKIYALPNELIIDLENNDYYDIYLCDIEMPGSSGMDLAYFIRKNHSEPYIIFITSYRKYDLEAFEYNAFRYILKDQIQDKLELALFKISNEISQRVEKFYIIETSSRIEKLIYSEILYIYIIDKYSYFKMRNNGERRVRKSLKNVIKELNSPEFIFTDKSYIVNIQHIMQLRDHTAIIRGGDESPVSIPRFDEVKKAISQYWHVRK